MMVIRSIIITTLLSFSICACSKPDPKSIKPENTQASEYNLKIALMNCYISPRLSEKGLSEWITHVKHQLAEMKTCDLDPQQDHCQEVIVDLPNAPITNDSNNMRVLVIDTGDYTRLHYRHKDRVLAQYRLNSDTMKYEKVKKRIKVRAFYDRVMADIREKFKDAPSYAFGCLHSVLSNISKDVYSGFDPNEMLPEMQVSHGNDIAGFIAEYSPSAQFVFANLMTPSKKSICSMSELPLEDWERAFKEETSSIASSILNIVKEHRINFINYSAGDEAKTVSQLFSYHECKGPPPSWKVTRKYLEILNEYIYRPLSSMRSVALVQAAVNAPGLLQNGDPRFLTDCTEYDGRLRVNQFGVEHRSLFNVNLPVSHEDIGSSRNIGSKICSDIYVNTGNAGSMAIDLTNHPHNVVDLYRLTSDGIQSSPLYAATSSFAAPIATSMLLYKVLRAQTKDPKYMFDSFSLLGEYRHQRERQLYDPRVTGEMELCELDPVYCNPENMHASDLVDEIVILKE